MTVRVGAGSDVGLRRSGNEDRYGIAMPEGAEAATRGVLLVVADGMGGAMAGEVASQLAVDCVLKTYRDARGAVVDDLREAIVAANRVIHEHSRVHPELRGMGTTCTAVVLRDGEIAFAHVGDSRAYFVRDGAIRQVTADHSLVAQLVEHRHITPEQAKVDPRRNVVTRSVGVGAEVDVDAARFDVAPAAGDTVLICSDGLHTLVEDHEIAQAASGPDLDEACAELIALANERGGSDNITVVIGRFGD
jgi:PPM family protein phosphatase